MSGVDLGWAVGAVALILALCLAVVTRLLSPKRFAQILGGVGCGLALAYAATRVSTGGVNG